ncbi:hypothetical protein VT03_01215 [Planctomyces sp. SH-PL14]|nr:hypothetical protein VT03_01215 [Planctomyces sp. SH-PL14]
MKMIVRASMVASPAAWVLLFAWVLSNAPITPKWLSPARMSRTDIQYFRVTEEYLLPTGSGSPFPPPAFHADENSERRNPNQ